MHLADLGAEVIKIENPRMPDMTRLMGSKFGGDGKEGPTGLFYAVNRNKKSISLNIKRPEGREVLLKLLETADILLEGFRPDTLEEMGIGYTSLHAKFPGLIYCAISGYGATGPAKDRAGHDGNYIAEADCCTLPAKQGGRRCCQACKSQTQPEVACLLCRESLPRCFIASAPGRASL